jgi:Tfp pilus assembly protein PilF
MFSIKVAETALLRDNVYLHLVFIVFAIVLVYSNTLDVPFTFDDDTGIVENPVIHDLDYFISPSEASGFKKYFGYESFCRRYITFLSFALNYRLHGVDVRGYHAVNILIHMLNAALVYALVLMTLRTPRLSGSGISGLRGVTALLVAMLFAVHPLQTQAVTYVWQRSASLAALWYLLSMAAYIRWRLSGGGRWSAALYALALVSAVLGMLTKETVFTLPVVLVLYEIMFLEAPTGRRVRMLLPLALTMLVIPLNIYQASGTGAMISEAGPGSILTRGVYLMTQFRVLVTYIRLLFFPVNQNLDYDYPVTVTAFDPQMIASLVFLLMLGAVSIFLFIRSRRQGPELRVISFGILFFFITISVESSLIPIKDIIFEHRAYLPSVGLFSALVVMGGVFAMKISAARLKGMLALAAVFVVFVFSISAYSRNLVWGSQVELWEDVLHKSPRKARANYYLAKAYVMEREDAEKALIYLNRAVKLKPDFYWPYQFLAEIYKSRGQYDKAITLAKRAVELAPQYRRGYALDILGFSYSRTGRIDEAEAAYLEVLQEDPGSTQGLVTLADFYKTSGRYREAIPIYEDIIRNNPEMIAAYEKLATSHALGGELGPAIDTLNRALVIDPRQHGLRLKLGMSYLDAGLHDKARKELGIVLKADPGNRLARTLLNSMGAPASERP